MPKQKRISGKELTSKLIKIGFYFNRQVGSHVRLTKQISNSSFSITIPLHKELDRGTLHSIYKIISEHIPKKEIEDIFFNE